MKSKWFLPLATLVVVVSWLALISNFFGYLKKDKIVRTSGKQMGYFYEVTLLRKEQLDPKTFELSEYLNETFKQADGKIVFDIRNVNPYKLWNQDTAVIYYLSPAPLDPEDNYSTDKFSIQIQKAPDNLLPYLYGTQYCQTDSDCVARNEGCAFGGFNYYSDYMKTYNCGDPVDKDGVKGDGTPYYYGKADPAVGCSTGRVWVEYNGASCQNNICRGTNRKINCQR